MAGNRLSPIWKPILGQMIKHFFLQYWLHWSALKYIAYIVNFFLLIRVIQYCVIFPRYTAPIGIMKPIRTNKGIHEGLIYFALVQLNHLAFILLNVFTNFKIFRTCLFFNLYSKRSLECFKLFLFLNYFFDKTLHMGFFPNMGGGLYCTFVLESWGEPAVIPNLTITYSSWLREAYPEPKENRTGLRHQQKGRQSGLDETFYITGKAKFKPLSLV